MTQVTNIFHEDVARQWLRDLLRTNIVEVIFTKSDGTERKLKCTLKADKLPLKEDSDNETPKKKPNPDLLSVYDVENNGWRSFRFDSIKSVEFSLGE